MGDVTKINDTMPKQECLAVASKVQDVVVEMTPRLFSAMRGKFGSEFKT